MQLRKSKADNESRGKDWSKISETLVCSVIRLQMESSHISLNKSVVRMEMILKPLPKTQR
ncbi:hypothetical protein GBA52_015400 [Prunus armeniaca]|nr:hypothetical protein GBA52_015400 [Prunus armeniaca]